MRTLYCNPDGRVVTPFSLALVSKNSLPLLQMIRQPKRDNISRSETRPIGLKATKHTGNCTWSSRYWPAPPPGTKPPA